MLNLHCRWVDAGNEEELNTWGTPRAPPQVVFNPSAAFKSVPSSEEDSDSDRSGDGWQSNSRQAAARRLRQEDSVEDAEGSLTKRQKLLDPPSAQQMRIPSSDETVVSGTTEVSPVIERIANCTLEFMLGNNINQADVEGQICGCALENPDSTS